MTPLVPSPYDDPLLHISRVLRSFGSYTPEACRTLLENGDVEPYRKDEIVFHVNRLNDYEYFQLTGITHRFNVDKDTTVVTTGIHQNEAVITPHFARTKNGKCIFSLQALTDSAFLKIPVNSFESLRRSNPEIEKLAHAVIEQEFIRSLNFEVLFRSSSARERLLYLRENYHQLENIIPHAVIASFLGITSVSLSRLRSDLAK